MVATDRSLDKGGHQNSAEGPAIALNEIHARALERLAIEVAELTGEPVAMVRRAVELSVVTRGIAWVRENMR
jgi:hypothetical protein